MNLFKNFCCIVLFALLLVSCTSKKEILYFQNIDQLEALQTASYTTVIRKNDLLSIFVSSRNMENVQFLNRSMSSISSPSTSNGSGVSTASQNYLVDSKGFIDFPTLGAIHVAGKSKKEVSDFLESKIRELTTDAEVSIRILNFKITVLGEVNSPGTFQVSDERLTIPQALGLAGDLTIFGERKNVLLLRDKSGVQESYRIDLTSADMINSDYYYLQQNDLLYVAPNKAEANNGTFSRSTGIYVSIATFALTLIILLTR
jgi:polysaccharide export outer membrane protein